MVDCFAGGGHRIPVNWVFCIGFHRAIVGNRFHARPDHGAGQRNPFAFGSGEWTCVVCEFEGGGRTVTVAKWKDGAIAEEYIWA
ncbi:hypothetical protein ABIB27_003325 [Arthrobacter sp. UYEF21]